MADTAATRSPNLPKGKVGDAAGSPKSLKKKAPEPEETVMSNGLDDVESRVETNGEQEDGETETGEGVTANGEEYEEGSDAVPIGSVDGEGNVVDGEGKVVGRVNGEAPEGSIVDTEGDVLDAEGNVIGKAEPVEQASKDVNEDVGEAAEGAENHELASSIGAEDRKVTNEGDILHDQGSAIGENEPVEDPGKDIEGALGGAAEGAADPELASSIGAQDKGEVAKEGSIPLDEGSVVGKAEHAGSVPHDEGSIVGKAEHAGSVPHDEGSIVGKPEPVEDPGKGVEGSVGEAAEGAADPELAGSIGAQDKGEVAKEGGIPLDEGSVVGKAEHAGKDVEGDVGEIGQTGKDIEGTVDEAAKGAADPELASSIGAQDKGEVADKSELGDKVLDEKDLKDVESEPQLPEQQLDLTILKGKKVNKRGMIVDDQGTPVGQLVEGDPKKLAGKTVDGEGRIWDNAGKVIGRAEPLPDADREATPSSPFEDFPDSVVDAKGNVIFEGRIVGKLVEGDPKKLEGKKVDADGDILDKHGNTLGKAERFQEDEPLPEEPEVTDLSILEGKKVNKAGNVVDENGKLFGRVVDGEVSKLVGRKCDAQGKIWSSSGKVIGTAELVPVDDRDEDSGALFEDFPDAVVDPKGNILFQGQVVGKLIQGDAKKLAGKKIDKDGEVVDKIGNVLGKAERWTAPDEPEPEAVDTSALAGKRVNKIGNVVDSNGQIFGRLVQGDPRKLVGKMCDKNGNVMNEMGQVVGKAELVPESEREGEKTGPFADFDNPTVAKDGKVVDAKGTIIGRVIDGDAKKLFGKPVDPDGDILDKNGNTLGKAERWEEEEKETSKHPAAGRKVNRKGEVVDANGDVIAKLTEGDITKCAGREIDSDGDVVDSKGKAVGHVTLLEDIPAPVEEVKPEPEPEPEQPKETEEEIEQKKQLQQDRKLAGQLAACIEQTIDKIKPILKMITDAIEAAERQPKDELDEQKLVDTVKPLLEEGGQILQECNGAIRALDPDGRIQTNAKHKTASREATPEEYRLAEQLKELTGSVATTIDQAKKKIAGMPHAKKELNPLWGLLAEPLGQIIAAVGLLLSGVLGLVGRLLSVLGLGGLLDNLLGGLGIKGILEGLGLGTLTKSLTGKK